jgi:hypothetical protein
LQLPGVEYLQPHARARGNSGMTVMNTRDRNSIMGGEPLRFRLGCGSVIKALDQVRVGARDRDTRRAGMHRLSALFRVCSSFEYSMQQGLPKMVVGDHVRIIASPDLCYGSKGFYPLIPANSALIIQVGRWRQHVCVSCLSSRASRILRLKSTLVSSHTPRVSRRVEGWGWWGVFAVTSSEQGCVGNSHVFVSSQNSKIRSSFWNVRPQIQR